jgi:WD domain, G-beta repeat
MPRPSAGRTGVVTSIRTAGSGLSVKAAGITLPRDTTDTIGIARSGLSVNRIPPRRQRRARAAPGVGAVRAVANTAPRNTAIRTARGGLPVCELWPKDGAGEPLVLSQGNVVTSLTVLADGRLASGSWDGKIKFWPKDGAGEPVVLSQGSWVKSLTVLADGRLASGDADGKIKLWLTIAPQSIRIWNAPCYLEQARKIDFKGISLPMPRGPQSIRIWNALCYLEHGGTECRCQSVSG